MLGHTHAAKMLHISVKNRIISPANLQFQQTNTSLSTQDNRHIGRFLGLALMPYFNVLHNNMIYTSLKMVSIPRNIGREKYTDKIYIAIVHLVGF